MLNIKNLAIKDLLPDDVSFDLKSNIEFALKNYSGRVKELLDEPIALVGYGPSLRRTWELLRGYKHIMTMSGSHDFLVERQILPRYHIEVDSLGHKVLNCPNIYTKYLISSTCHPNLFKSLDRCSVYLWHLDLGPEIEYPEGEAVFAASTCVGNQAVMMAALMGYKNIHCFGMDCSFEEGQQHAGPHANETEPMIIVKCGDRQFETKMSFVVDALEFKRLVQKLPFEGVRIVGDTMLRELMKDATGSKYSVVGSVERDLRQVRQEEEVVGSKEGIED